MTGDASTPTQRAKPNDDPALAMSTMWLAQRDQYEDLLRHASERERAVLQLSFGADPTLRDEAQRQFEAATRASDVLGDKLDTFASAIFATKAQTLEGAAAKLTVAIRLAAPADDSEDEPWPSLRSVQADLDRLRAAAANANERPDEPAG